MYIANEINTVATAKTGAEVREPIIKAIEAFDQDEYTLKKIKPTIDGTSNAFLNAIESKNSYDITYYNCDYFIAGNQITKSRNIILPESVSSVYGTITLMLRSGSEIQEVAVEPTIQNGKIHYEYDLGTKEASAYVYIEIHLFAVKEAGA